MKVEQPKYVTTKRKRETMRLWEGDAKQLNCEATEMQKCEVYYPDTAQLPYLVIYMYYHIN